MRSSAATKAKIFFALGDETRLALVGRLASGESQSIAALTGAADVTRQAITKHLRVLSDAGLVRRSKSGRETLWALRPQKIDEAKRYLGQIGDEWDRAIARLKALVEE